MVEKKIKPTPEIQNEMLKDMSISITVMFSWKLAKAQTNTT